MVLADSHGISRVPRYSGTHPSSQIDFVYRSVTFYGATFQRLRLSIWLITRRPCGLTGPTTPESMPSGLGWCAFSLAATCGITDLFSSPGGTEMVHFPPLPSRDYEFIARYSGMSQSGFPHSEIPGSKTACVSPRLI